MIIGTGMVASYFQNHEDVIFFCSGVSDSNMKDEKEFAREQKLLSSMPRDKYLVYTSSLSVVLNKTPYQRHKMNMESLACQFPNHLVFRVGNLVGKQQRNYQFLPAIVNQVQKGYVEVWRCKRDILMTSDYVKIVDKLLAEGKVGMFRLCSSACPSVSDIVDEIINHVGTRCVKHMIDIEEIDVFHPDIVTGRDDYYRSVIQWYFTICELNYGNIGIGVE